ncbi:unnamed protein product [Gulo gulo]|uniref:Uncharacterized protein n=1 Tax=Gulo gulo TaxID=48420 RepID=A0A9X9LX31_GULGU|nr:unnamed protein product [Gulo gulo]
MKSISKRGNSRSGTSCSFVTTTAPGPSRCSTQRRDTWAYYSVCCRSGPQKNQPHRKTEKELLVRTLHKYASTYVCICLL